METQIEFAAAPEWVEERVSAICAALPEVVEPRATYPPGARRWRVRDGTFCTLFSLNGVPVIEFLAQGEDLAALQNVGPPFSKAPWGGDVIVCALSETTDWVEVAEVIADSYCIAAPKKLVRLVRGE